MTHSTELPAGQRFDLTAVAPVRALAISAGAAVVAIALIAVWTFTEAVVALVLGLVVLILAVGLALVALLLTRRLRTSVVLDPRAISVRGRRTQSLDWSEVEHVTLRGSRLTLTAKTGPGSNLVVVNPRAASDATFVSLVAAIRSRLDDDRGYGDRIF